MKWPTVNTKFRNNFFPDNLDLVSQKLVQLAKDNGSSDNITIIVVFFKPVEQLVTVLTSSKVLQQCDQMVEFEVAQCFTKDAQKVDTAVFT